MANAQSDMHDLRFLAAFLFLLEIAGCIHNLHQPPSVSFFSTLLPPSFSSLHLFFSLLAIWLLQPPSLAYCRMCRCHRKLFTFQHFGAVLRVYKLQDRHFIKPFRTGVGKCELETKKRRCNAMICYDFLPLTSLFTQILSSITSSGAF